MRAILANKITRCVHNKQDTLCCRCKSRMPTKRPTTAFFVFCNEHRDACKADYVAQSGSDKVSVAAVAKLLGEKWRGLPDEQKMHYQQLAAKKAAAIAAEESVNDLELNNDTSSQVVFL